MDILIASGQPNLRFSLEVFLRQQPGLVVIGTVSDAESLLAVIHTARPDLVVLDWELPSYPLVKVLSEVKAAEHPPHFIVLGKELNTAQVALDAGADEFLGHWDDPPTTLLAAIRRAGSSQEAPDQDDAAHQVAG
jgi:DNA-binding NarL/FixJ family response regulator